MRRAVAGAALALAVAPASLAQTPAPGAADRAYDARLRESAEAAEQFQGPLDGGWVLDLEGQGARYALQLTDTGSALDGAWRDLRRPGASGLIERIERRPKQLTLRFTPPGEPPVTVAIGARYRGELRQGGAETAVVLRRARSSVPGGSGPEAAAAPRP